MAISNLKVKIKLTKRITFWPTYLVLVGACLLVRPFNSDRAESLVMSMSRLMFNFLYKVEVN